MTHETLVHQGRLLLVIAGILTGCTSFPAPVNTFTPVSSATVPSIEQPLVQMTPAPTKAVTPRPVATQDIEAPPRLRITATSTSLPPLATQEEALTFVRHMQVTNGGCELPCWWGITPGKTTAQEAAQILSPLKNFPGLRSEYGFHLDEYSALDVGIYADGPSKPIKFIQIQGVVPFEKGSKQFDMSWQSYSVSGLLAGLGKPSEVWIGVGHPTGDSNPNSSKSVPFLYELFVFYHDLGLRVQYLGRAVKGDPNRACLSLDQVNEIRLFLQQRSAEPVGGPPAEPYTRMYPISQVSDLDIDAFYQTFKSPNTQECIELPAKYWP